MSDPPILAGLRGVVLGVSGKNGLGYRCAELFRRLGAEIAITHRPSREAEGARLGAELGAGLVLPADAGDDASLDRAFASIDRAWGRLDFLLHTWVYVPEGVLARPLVALGREDFATVMEISAYSLVAACRYAKALLARSASPRVVALTSSQANHMTPNYHVVGIAKAALDATVLYLAHELGREQILCNAVSFSLIETDAAVRALGKTATGVTREYLAKRSPTRRAVELEDVASAVAFMVSPLCRNTTGEVLTVDGGFSRSYF